ncbi:STAS domain-containing protein [Geitlerinema sp. CS-897]|nr:STAS domain-containing protein [Geitlerinema sp. CS-897]
MAIVLRPHGKLDARGAAKLRRKLQSLVASSPKNQTTWIVDLSDIRSIDRNGLTALVALRRCASKANCKLVLRDISESVRSLLQVAHLESSFEIRQGKSPDNTSESRPNPSPLTPAADISKLPTERSSPPTIASQPTSLEVRDSYSIELET